MLLTPKGYTNIGQIQNYLLTTIKDYFQPQVEDWIAKMEKYIERETSRVFIADDSASEKLYDGNGKINLFVEENVEVSKVTIDSDEVSGDDYITYPANETPKSRIKLKDSAGFLFSKGEQNIKVEAKWGYSVECPADIAFAATVLAAGVINFSGEMKGEIESEKIGDYSVTYKKSKDWQDFQRAKEILENYRKIIIA